MQGQCLQHEVHTNDIHRFHQIHMAHEMRDRREKHKRPNDSFRQTVGLSSRPVSGRRTFRQDPISKLFVPNFSPEAKMTSAAPATGQANWRRQVELLPSLSAGDGMSSMILSPQVQQQQRQTRRLVELGGVEQFKFKGLKPGCFSPNRSFSAGPETAHFGQAQRGRSPFAIDDDSASTQSLPQLGDCFGLKPVVAGAGHQTPPPTSSGYSNGSREEGSVSRLHGSSGTQRQSKKNRSRRMPLLGSRRSRARGRGTPKWR